MPETLPLPPKAVPLGKVAANAVSRRKGYPYIIGITPAFPVHTDAARGAGEFSTGKKRRDCASCTENAAIDKTEKIKKKNRNFLQKTLAK